MAKLECKDCGDMVDVEARTVTLPFVCKWCTEDSEQGFDFEPKTPLDSYVLRPHSKFVVEFLNIRNGKWFRSGNPNSSGVFDSFLEAQKQADISAKKSRASLKYRVVLETPEPETSEFPSEIQTSESQKSETSTSTTSQSNLDSELIEDLQSQLEEANRNREEWIEKYASLITEIGIKDARIRVLESEAIERNRALEKGLPLLTDYVKLLKGLVGLATTYQFEDNLEGLTFLLESQKKAIAARDEAVKAYKESASFFYKEYRGYEEKYFSEQGKTWWERLWS